MRYIMKRNFNLVANGKIYKKKTKEKLHNWHETRHTPHIMVRRRWSSSLTCTRPSFDCVLVLHRLLSVALCIAYFIFFPPQFYIRDVTEFAAAAAGLVQKPRWTCMQFSFFSSSSTFFYYYFTSLFSLRIPRKVTNCDGACFRFCIFFYLL